MEKRALALALLILAGCREAGPKKVDPPPPDAGCGDGVINPGEDCEGSDLQGQSCQRLGFDTGTLTCSQCQYSTALCVKRCPNGVVDPGESCDGDAGVGACLTFGYQACSGQCQLDSNHCVATLLVPGPALQLTKGGPAVIADLEPRGLGDLVMTVPSFNRLESFGWSLQQGFLAGRKVSFSRTPLWPAAADLDGDGRVDLAAINDDGAIDRFVFNGNGFTFEPLADAGSAAARWLGTSGGGDGGASLVALGGADGGSFSAVIIHRPSGAPLTVPLACTTGALADLDRDGRADALLVDGAQLWPLLAPGWDAGAPLSLPAAPLAIAGGDLDGDGDLDLAAIDATWVRLWENTGSGFAERTTFPAAGAHSPFVVDLDLDGRPDVLWQQGDQLVLRRNLGGWAFAPTGATLGAGAPLSLAVGDVDGDGDLDVAATHSAGGDATVTWVVVNKVR